MGNGPNRVGIGSAGTERQANGKGSPEEKPNRVSIGSAGTDRQVDLQEARKLKRGFQSGSGPRQ